MEKLIIDTNEHFADPDKRWKAIMQTVIASSRIEGIILTKKQQLEIETSVREKLKE